MNLTKVPLYLLIGLLQCSTISSVGCDVVRSRPQCSQLRERGRNVSVDLVAANPDDLGLISADQVFAPDFTNPVSTSDDYIDSISSVCFTRLDGGDIQGN